MGSRLIAASTAWSYLGMEISSEGEGGVPNQVRASLCVRIGAESCRRARNLSRNGGDAAGAGNWHDRVGFLPVPWCGLRLKVKTEFHRAHLGRGHPQIVPCQSTDRLADRRLEEPVWGLPRHHGRELSQIELLQQHDLPSVAPREQTVGPTLGAI